VLQPYSNHVATHGSTMQVIRLQFSALETELGYDVVSVCARPAAMDIPHGLVSRAAWYPARHGAATDWCARAPASCCMCSGVSPLCGRIRLGSAARPRARRADAEGP
jgi:hypothetical protein